MIDSELRVRALLSVQRALVGGITPGMRWVAVDLAAGGIHLVVWHDGPVPDEVREDFDAEVVTQVVSDFPSSGRGDPEVSFEFIRCDRPERPAFRGILVFGRREDGL